MYVAVIPRLQGSFLIYTLVALELSGVCTMKPPNFKFQGTYLINPGWPVKPWPIIGHVMKAMHLILHPTGFGWRRHPCHPVS